MAVKIDNNTINIVIYPYNTNNRGIVEVKISSPFAFWRAICDYAQK